MNLWVINQFASTPETNSGAGERFYYLGKEFAKNGLRVTVFSGNYNHLFLQQPSRSLSKRVEEIAPGFKFVWLFVTKYNSKSGVSRLLNWLSFVASLFLSRKKEFGAPDVILISSMSIWPILNGVFWKKKYPSAKLIFETRDIWPLTPVLLGGMSKTNPVVRFMFFLEKWAYKNADELVSVLPQADKRIKEVIGSKPENFHWIPNGILAPSYEVEDKGGLTTQRDFVIMYAGAIGKANCMDVLIEAANELTHLPIKFKIFGDGPLRNDLIEKAKQLAKVEFIGKIPKSELPEHLKNADACFISWHDSDLYKFGVSANKYNDYMRAARPIISCSGIDADPVRAADCGIQVPAENKSELVNAIIELYETPKNKRLEMGKRGFNYLMSNQVYSVLAKKYLDIIHGPN